MLAISDATAGAIFVTTCIILGGLITWIWYWKTHGNDDDTSL